MMRRTIVLGRLVLTVTRQPGGQPWVDPCSGETAEGRSWRGWAIAPSWRRSQFDRGPATALVIGWAR